MVAIPSFNDGDCSSEDGDKLHIGYKYIQC